MKIRRDQLRKIIKEEVLKLVKELNLLSEINPYHKADGTWGSKKTGNVKSLSRAAVRKHGLDPKHAGKGIVAKDPDKTRVKYNMSDCGRTDVETGKDREIKYSCRDYPKKYDENLILSEEEEAEREELKMTPKQYEIYRKQKRANQYKVCTDEFGLRPSSDVIRTYLDNVNSYQRAGKGDLYRPKDKN